MGNSLVPRIIDADSHVMEAAEVWEHLPADYVTRRPFIITGENKPFLQGMNSFWYIDGRTFPQPVGRGVSIYATPVTQARATRKPWALGSQTLLDIPERLADLDRAGFDVQVNFPTLFLEPLTEDAGFEAALVRSYNSFMAERSRQASERLKWAALQGQRVPAPVPDLLYDRGRREQSALCAGVRRRRSDYGVRRHAPQRGARECGGGDRGAGGPDVGAEAEAAAR